MTDAHTNYGERLGALRQARRLSLRRLAGMASLSPAALSKIENGVNSPSVSTMKRIVGALGLTLSEFFSMAESDDPGPRYHYPVDQLINLSPAEGVSLMALPSRQTERKLQVLYETYAPGAGTGREPLVHSGEDAGFCLSGKMELTIDGRTIIIGPGEAFHYPSDRPHSWRNIGKTKATLATACTPPSF